MKKYPKFSRTLAFLLVLAMLLPCISMTAFSQDIPCAQVGCSGKYQNGICSKDAAHFEAAPEEGGVYKISNAGQLYWFAALVNAGENDADAALTADITINADMAAEGKLAWTPIGLYTSAREFVSYAGTFDGAGHTIYGLYYDNTNYDGRNAGLFGTLAEEGVVKNLTLDDSVINGATEIGGIAAYNYGEIIGCTNAAAVTGTGATGGIVCRNLGTVENCTNTGAVTGATTGGIAAENNGEVVDCANSGVITGTSSVGGIVGMNDGTVENSLNTANVTATNTHVGGVVGNHVGGEINRCGNTGNVTGASDYIGGVAGVCSGAEITESYNTGKVTGEKSKSEAVGGVVGAIDGTNTAESSITSCYNTGKVIGRGWVGGIAGISGYQKTPKTVTFGNSYNTGAVEGTSHVGAVVGKLTKGTASGTYYLQGAQNSVSGTIAATAEQFASGEIANELNKVSNVWFQALDIEGMEPDASPVLDATHGTVYAGYCNCTDQGYTNRENYNEPGDHVDEDYDQVCDACGAILGEPHEHEFGEWTRTKEPTCSEYGEETRICSICNYPQKRNVEKLPHTEEIIPGTPATFDEPGLTDGKKCSVCGEIIVQQTEAPVRDYNEGIIPLNVLNVSVGDYEENGGATEGGANLAVDDNFDTLWHTDWTGTSRANHWFQFEITEDYTVTGLRYKPRISGGANGIILQYEIKVSNDGESWETVTSGNWADDRNWKVAEIDNLNVKYVRLYSLDATSELPQYVFASAAEIRLTGVKAGETPVCEHENTEVRDARAATCTEDGYTGDTYCLDCGELVTKGEVIAAKGHTEVVVPGKAATCTETGLTEGKKCSVCGETLVAQEVVAALGHTEEIIPAVAPTCTETGLTEGKKCSVCGETLVAQEVIPALGHDFVNGECSRCDATSESSFEDVKAGDFFFDPVEWAVENGITNGSTEPTFNPDGDLLRAQVVTMLWRHAGSPVVDIANPFNDVKEGEWYYNAVLWAYSEGITAGTSATTFNPTGKTNRAQAVTFLWRYLDEPEADTENPFGDVDTNEWYGKAVLWAVANGVTEGMSADQFGITINCNRAHMVTFMYRALA